MKKNSLIVGGFVLLLVGFGYVFLSQPKMAYVNINDLYNGFEYKKTLEKQYEQTRLKRQNILDSLTTSVEYLKTQILSRTEKDTVLTKRYMYLMQQYQIKEKEFTEDNNRMAQELMNNILNQLNQYVKDFGKEKGYDFIYGANNDGALMYAKDAHNLTDELIVYINQRYEGAE